MTPLDASVAREVIDLLFSVVRKECVMGALNAQGISEDMVRGAIGSLDALAALDVASAETMPATPNAKKKRRKRR